MAAGTVTFVSVVSHGILDAATDAGLGIGFFIPFDNERYFLPFRPLETSAVDPGVFLANSSRALDILANELLWVGLPLLFFTLILQGIKFVKKVFWAAAEQNRPAEILQRSQPPVPRTPGPLNSSR